MNQDIPLQELPFLSSPRRSYYSLQRALQEPPKTLFQPSAGVFSQLAVSEGSHRSFIPVLAVSGRILWGSIRAWALDLGTTKLDLSPLGGKRINRCHVWEPDGEEK